MRTLILITLLLINHIYSKHSDNVPVYRMIVDMNTLADKTKLIADSSDTKFQAKQSIRVRQEVKDYKAMYISTLLQMSKKCQGSIYTMLN